MRVRPKRRIFAKRMSSCVRRLSAYSRLAPLSSSSTVVFPVARPPGRRPSRCSRPCSARSNSHRSPNLYRRLRKQGPAHQHSYLRERVPRQPAQRRLIWFSLRQPRRFGQSMFTSSRSVRHRGARAGAALQRKPDADAPSVSGQHPASSWCGPARSPSQTSRRLRRARRAAADGV